MTSKTVNIRIMDRIAGQYAIYGLDDVILNTEGLMQMRYNIIILILCVYDNNYIHILILCVYDNVYGQRAIHLLALVAASLGK